MNHQQKGESDGKFQWWQLLFVLLSFAVPYVYTLHRQKDLLDPTGQYLSRHGIMACIVGGVSAVVAFLLMLLLGHVGCLIAVILIAGFLKRAVDKITEGDEHPAH